MFIESPLENRQIDICFLDNTYLEPEFADIPSRREALSEIIQLIECKKKKNSKLIFSIILRNLGKENMLVEIAQHFKTRILISTERYQRYIDVLKLDETNFTTKLTNDTLIYVEDEHLNSFKISKDKTIIRIKPTALEYVSSKRLKSLPVIIEVYSESSSKYYNVPYTDHSSYNELIEFVKKLRPKRVIPIVPDLEENKICNTDISVFDDYLNYSSPIKEPNEEFFRLLNSKTKVKAYEKILREERLSEQSSNQRKLRPRHRVTDLVLHEKRYLPNRKAKLNKTQIEYESSPEKCSQTRDSDIEEPRRLRSSVRRKGQAANRASIRISNKKKRDETEPTSQSEDEEETIKSFNLRAKTFYDKQGENNSDNNPSICSPNKFKWTKLNQEVEILENLIGLNTSSNLEVDFNTQKKRSEQFEREECVQTDPNAGQIADECKYLHLIRFKLVFFLFKFYLHLKALITNDLATNDTQLSMSKKKSDLQKSTVFEHTQGSDNENKSANADISILDISISSIEEEEEEETNRVENNTIKDKENRSGSKDIINEESVIATDKQLVETSNSNNETIPTKESIETIAINENNAFLNCFTASLNSFSVSTTQDDYSDKFLAFLKNSFRY